MSTMAAADGVAATPPTGTRFTKYLGGVTLAGVALLLLLGLISTPADQNQGDSVRIMYVHVPTAWIAYLAFVVTAFASAMYLFRSAHSISWDRIAGASAEIGVLYMALTLITGSLWGRLTWGVFWEWDARLTTTAFLFVTYIGYLAVRRLGGTHDQRAKRSAIVALLAVLEIPLVHFSVRIWASLHQEPTVLRAGDVKMDGLMLFTLFWGVVTFTLMFVWLVVHRQRVIAMEDAIESRGLDTALEARRREGQAI